MEREKIWNDNWYKFIIHNINKNWNFEILSKNPNLTFNIIKLYPDMNWDFDELSLHTNIDWNIVKLLSHKKWNWSKLSKHPNLSFDFVKDNKDFNWDFWMLSHHPNLRYNIVAELKEKPWNMGFINDNPYINGNISNINIKNIDDVNDNSNSHYILCDVVLKIKRNYDFKELSRNNYLTSEILVLYIDKTW